MTLHPQLRNLDTISYEYMYTLMPLQITAADVGAIPERTYHCFARAAFPSSVPFQGARRDGREMGFL